MDTTPPAASLLVRDIAEHDQHIADVERQLAAQESRIHTLEEQFAASRSDLAILEEQLKDLQVCALYDHDWHFTGRSQPDAPQHRGLPCHPYGERPVMQMGINDMPPPNRREIHEQNQAYCEGAGGGP